MNDEANIDESAKHRDLLMTAFADTESTIRATDTKASIALIVHGFIFAGLIGVLSHLGAGFDDGSTCFRTLVITLTGLTGLVFLASITQLLRCVRPAPSSVIPKTPTQGVFYLSGGCSPWTGYPTGMLSFEQLKDRLGAMRETDIDTELTAELLKVSAIRARKVSLASTGLELLGLEVLFAVLLLSVLAVQQI